MQDATLGKKGKRLFLFECMKQNSEDSRTFCETNQLSQVRSVFLTVKKIQECFATFMLKTLWKDVCFML